MGREVRRVPADWKHPRKRCEHSPWNGGCSEAKLNGGMCFMPLHDSSYLREAREWLDGAVAWDNGTDPDCAKWKAKHPFYWTWHGNPPDPRYYRPEWPEGSRTHYQMYETVSEGTPISPVMESPEALARWLTDNEASAGGDETATYEAWLRVCRGGYAPSMILMNGRLMSGVEGISELEKDK